MKSEKKGKEVAVVSTVSSTESAELADSVLASEEVDFVVASTWRLRLRAFTKNRFAVISIIFLILLALACYFGGYFYHTNQTNVQELISTLAPQNAPPSAAHWLGTDYQGFDILGRILYAGQSSLTLGFLAGVVTIVVGTVYGMVSGFFGGIVDGIMMRILDAALSIPGLFLLITVVAVFGRSTTMLILVIGFTGWFGNARIVRGDALLIRNLDYAKAARMMGGRRSHIIIKHVMPNSMGNIVTVGTFAVADAVLALASLGFLGLGVPAPATDWGTMLNQGVNALWGGYWFEVFPVTIVFILVIVAINSVGDALRDMFEVRLLER
jgi:peptide/nickel transport system permease protein